MIADFDDDVFPFSLVQKCFEKISRFANKYSTLVYLERSPTNEFQFAEKNSKNIREINNWRSRDSKPSNVEQLFGYNFSLELPFTLKL